MQKTGVAVAVHSGAAAPRIGGSPLEVDAAVAVPVAFGGLRRILSAISTFAPEVVSRVTQSNPAEWNRLFPGSVHGAPDLSDLALSPSERRLHRESEQTFWILNTAARVIVEALRETGKPLVIRNAGASDLVSLRGVMRAIEWARIEGVSGQVVLTGWSQTPGMVPSRFADRRREYLEVLRKRMRAPLEQSSGTGGVLAASEAPVDLESSYLHAALDPAQELEHRLAAAVLAIRACFFTTNYEGAMLAAELGLSLLDSSEGSMKPAAVVDAWKRLDDTGFISPAIEIDASSLGDAEELRALFFRQVGVVHAFSGEFDKSLHAFLQGAERKISPERHGQMRMFRALTFIKRVGNLEKARAEIEAGLQGMANRRSDENSLHEGWLRNVYALTYFQEKKFEPAMHQEKLAMRCVGELHDPSATHLKINLISNVSVLQESAKMYSDAISTWRRFEKISSSWGANFLKHHSYRLAGLLLKSGQREDAVTHYVSALTSARALGDPFHSQVISAELGRLALDENRREDAVRWFEEAVEASNRIGDPLRIGQSVAGLALAKGTSEALAEANAVASQTSTYGEDAKRLDDAIASGQPDAIKAALPPPRSKLNRPFDLVNL